MTRWICPARDSNLRLPRFCTGGTVLEPGSLRYNPQNDIIFPSIFRAGDRLEPGSLQVVGLPRTARGWAVPAGALGIRVGAGHARYSSISNPNSVPVAPQSEPGPLGYSRLGNSRYLGYSPA